MVIRRKNNFCKHVFILVTSLSLFLLFGLFCTAEGGGKAAGEDDFDKCVRDYLGDVIGSDMEEIDSRVYAGTKVVTSKKEQSETNDCMEVWGSAWVSRKEALEAGETGETEQLKDCISVVDIQFTKAVKWDKNDSIFWQIDENLRTYGTPEGVLYCKENEGDDWVKVRDVTGNMEIGGCTFYGDGIKNGDQKQYYRLIADVRSRAEVKDLENAPLMYMVRYQDYVERNYGILIAVAVVSVMVLLYTVNRIRKRK
ncbi:MAG: hypothetical protein Q4F21_13525 [Lachnospiraceae bacterium]|nr:hypothetical protein [Lachnospiraceae bacterium]